MRRREFLKATGVGAGLAGCSTEPWRRLPLLVHDAPRALASESWRPGLCRECDAGCGVLARVVDAETSGRRVVKLEGNPRHPISGGALCARGQVALDRLYDPDRLLQPLARTGAGPVEVIAWHDATARIATAVAGLANPRRLVVVGDEPRGTAGVMLDRWLAGLGAEPMYRARGEDDAWREAVRLMTGESRAPGFDLGGVAAALVFGADLLGAGPSPVRDSRGRAAQRDAGGRLVYVGTRFNLTAAAADRFLPCRPGTEGAVSLGVAHVLLRDHLVDRGRLADRVSGLDDYFGGDGRERPGFARIAQQYPPAKCEALSGVPAAAIEEVATWIAGNRPAIAIGGGAAAAHVASLASMMAVVALDGLIGGFDAGGLTFTAPVGEGEARPSHGTHDLLVRLADPEPIEVLFLVGRGDALAGIPELAVRAAGIALVVSHGLTAPAIAVAGSAGTQLALPATHSLEEWADDEPLAARAAVSLTAAVLPPRGEARALGDVVRDLAPASAGDDGAPGRLMAVEAASRARYRGLVIADVLETGTWSACVASPPLRFPTPSGKLELTPANPESMIHGGGGGMVATASELMPHFSMPRLAGDERELPLVLEPFASFAGLDGARGGALVEMGESLSGVKGRSWIEMHALVAERCGVRDGDLVEVTTPHGAARALVAVRAWASPEIVAVPWSLGASLAARDRVLGTGERAWAATRARVVKVGA